MNPWKHIVSTKTPSEDNDFTAVWMKVYYDQRKADRESIPLPMEAPVKVTFPQG